MLYLLSALALPGLSFFVLAVSAAGLALTMRARLSAMLGLAWRARWLFLLIGVGYAYSVPGTAAWPALGDYSPSFPGLDVAAHQMLRLLLLLWLLDVLVVGMGSERMMAGLHGVFASMRWLGFPAERTTVRLGLTLRAMERNALKLRELTGLLSGGGDSGPVDEMFHIVNRPWRIRDGLALAAALVVLISSWLV